MDQLRAIDILREIPYLGAQRAETLDLYMPVQAGRLRAAVVLIHGGGWGRGDKASPRLVALASTLASSGYVCASISYQVAGPLRPGWPRCVYDCKAAVRFLRHHATRYGLQPGAIGLLGGSWGGYLAALCAASADHALLDLAEAGSVSAAVQAIVAMYAPLDPVGLLHPDTLAVLFGGRQEQLPAAYAAADPRHYLTPGHPPLLLLHGTKDTSVPVTQTLDYSAALRHQAIEHQVVLLPGAGHVPDQTLLLPYMLAFLDRHLRQGQSSAG